ncbi:MAG: hypothetical protein AAF542_16390 [Pseudomonadota bacterium]
MKIESKKHHGLRKQRGQGMTEYIVIVALIAISAISVFALFGDTVENQVAGMASELAGGDGTAAQGAANTAAAAAVTDAATTNTLTNYTGNN